MYRRESINWGQVFRGNCLQVFFVILAFVAMVVVSAFFINDIVRQQVGRNVNEAMLVAEANIRAGFAKAEATMTLAGNHVERLLAEGASNAEIWFYLINTTSWIRSGDDWGIPLLGIYGYLRGEFLDGIDKTPMSGVFMPQTTPWFDTAVRNPGSRTAYTELYRDANTGNITLTAVRNIYGGRSGHQGFLAVDMEISWFERFAASFDMGDGSYGIVLNQHMVVVGHPRAEAVGSLLRDAAPGYSEIHDALIRQRGEISTMRIDMDGTVFIVSFRRMFNGWHIGVVTPFSSYYRDADRATTILSILGVILMGILIYFLLRTAATQIRAEEESRSKSTFLALMSHEIRTPMNAVIGLSELGRRAENHALGVEYFSSIQQAGQNLLSIIDDILDFSKIESGNLMLAPEPYTLASLMDDVVSIMRVRLAGKRNVVFLVNIDSVIPNTLIGDEVRVRQVLLNLLSNAVKYTAEGFIHFTVTGKRMGNSILLKFAVADSGIGIKPEDLEKLFADFVRFDALRNKGVEGTGLGLAITKRLCLAMGGDVTVSSVYGEGTVFTAVIPQPFENDMFLAEVRNAGEKTVLVYDTSPLYAQSICESLENMGVEAILAVSEEAFFKSLPGGYSLALFPSELAPKVRKLVKAQRPQTPLALLAKPDENIPAQDIPVLAAPAYAVSIAGVLNRERPTGGMDMEFVNFFTAPEARVLLVDDMPTNLVVAKGLLAPYEMEVDTCDSGEEAVALLREKDYDLVLMDHMMPGLDGIETTTLIRKQEKGNAVPIVALTANVVAGMRELFLQNGMDDFLAKPIDVSKLHDILLRWIPEKKQQAKAAPEQAGEKFGVSFAIDGLDTEKGLFMSGGTEANYRSVLKQYRRDAEARLAFLTFDHATSDLKHFITQAHALKSASGSIGAMALFEEGKALEDAGNKADLSFIRRHVDAFRERLANTCRNINAALDADKKERTGESQDCLARAESIPHFLRLKEALEAVAVEAVDDVMAELSAMPLDSESAELLLFLTDMVLISEFAEAGRAIDDFLENA